MEIIIEQAKITQYLLIPKTKNDKSKFLNDLGYFLHNWQELETDIRKIALENEPVFQKKHLWVVIYTKLKAYCVI